MRYAGKKKTGFAFGAGAIASALLFMILARLSAYRPDLLEKYYSSSLNKSFISILSRITGLLPISLGEVLFFILIAVLTYLVLMTIVGLFTRNLPKRLFNTAVFLAIVYTIFISFWGLNYSRISIREMAGLADTEYTAKELYSVTRELVKVAESERLGVEENNEGLMTVTGGSDSVIDRASSGYDDAWLQELRGQYGDAKPILLSGPMLYTGITGIYMPFTGEANVNVAVHDLLLPATVLHEMAHQRGIAYEDEANFVAFMVSRTHPDADFRYSGAMLALISSMNALARVDSKLYGDLVSEVPEDILRDIRDYGEFWKQYEGKAEEISEKINDTYLKGNGQADGVMSYGMMVDLLLQQYYQKGHF